jgi:dienelactone hydrolase
MAGNVKEWCWNEAGGRRYILGGAWNEPPYQFYEHDAQSPFARLGNFGFRCAQYEDGTAVALTLMRRPVPLPAPATAVESVSDEVFNAYKALFTFESVPLVARTLDTDESSASWRREKVAFRSLYGSEDVLAYLFLPTTKAPPFQTVVYFPGASAQRQQSPERLQTRMIDFLVHSGRAVMYPIYKGTHERQIGAIPADDSRSAVDYYGQLAGDLRQSLDYLQTRNDLEHETVGYYGFSWGAALAPIFLALDSRFGAAVLLDGGLNPGASRPEVAQVNYAPRVTIPVLMINGSYDAWFQLEASQQPLFHLLGTETADKEHVLYPSGHAVFTRHRNQAINGILDWFDRYLGPAP